MPEPSNTTPGRPTGRDVVVLAGFLALCFGASALGSVLFTLRMDDWYAALRKPSFNPPGWVFGPVWTVLYACMAIAAWLVWRRLGFSGGAGPLTLFAVQLALNAAWMPLFAGLKSPGLAFADIVALWVMIVATMVAFFRVSRPAGWLMAPYLAWTTFAAVLNFALWRMNT